MQKLNIYSDFVTFDSTYKLCLSCENADEEHLKSIENGRKQSQQKETRTGKLNHDVNRSGDGNTSRKLCGSVKTSRQVFPTGHECTLSETEIPWAGRDPDEWFCCGSCKASFLSVSELMSPPPPASAPLLEGPAPSPDSWWDLRTHKADSSNLNSRLDAQQKHEERMWEMTRVQHRVMCHVCVEHLISPPTPAAAQSNSSAQIADYSRQIWHHELIIPQKMPPQYFHCSTKLRSYSSAAETSLLCSFCFTIYCKSVLWYLESFWTGRGCNSILTNCWVAKRRCNTSSRLRPTFFFFTTSYFKFSPLVWVPLAQKYLNNCVAQQASLTSFYVFLLSFCTQCQKRARDDLQEFYKSRYLTNVDPK